MDNEIEVLNPKEVVLTSAGEGLIAEYNSKAIQLHDEAESLKIKNNEDYIQAGEILKETNETFKTIEDKRKSITQKIDSWKDFVMEIFGKSKDCLTGAKNIVGNKMLIYHNEQERKTKEEEDRIRKEQEAEARELERRALKAKGEDKKEELIQKAEEIRNIPPVVDRQIPKTSGVATKIIWHGEPIKGQEHLIERSLTTPDLVKINQLARLEKGTKKHPGIRIWCEKIIGGSR